VRTLRAKGNIQGPFPSYFSIFTGRLFKKAVQQDRRRTLCGTL